MTKHDSKDEDILAGAPKCATSVLVSPHYKFYDMDETRSLADIKELVELRKKNAELEISLNEVVEAVLDNRSKMVTIQTLDVIRAAIEKHGLTREQAKQLKVKNNPAT